MAPKIIITGCGTDVGKTVVSAIVTTTVVGDYWKPVQCGEEEESDTHIMKTLLDGAHHHVHLPAYSLKERLSPHHAARIENRMIDLKNIVPPATQNTLVIETAGGILVPLTDNEVSLDLMVSWGGLWIVVSKHYIGSINHTLLTIEALKNRRVSILGIIFNGENADSERAILSISGLPFIGRLQHEKLINTKTIQNYAQQWRTSLRMRLASLYADANSPSTY